MKVYTRKKNKGGTKTYTCGRAGCAHEVQAGETYYFFNPRQGPRRYRCASHYPRTSEMTASDKLSRLYGLQEGIEDFMASEWEPADPADHLRQAAEEAREVGSEYEESASNMEEYFQGSSQVDEIREKAQSCEDWADQLDEAADEIEGVDVDDFREDAEAELEQPSEEEIEARALELAREKVEELVNDVAGELQL